ncbi:MAG: hypothetical protein RL563_339 [Pseudomonadota bacterium]
MTCESWIKGRELLAKHRDEKRVMFEELKQQIQGDKLAHIEGTAIYMAKNPHGVPQVLLHNLKPTGACKNFCVNGQQAGGGQIS